MGRNADFGDESRTGPIGDGLVLPEIGSWGKRKYHFLQRFLDMFTTAMRDKWGELHYVDLFAGAGYARVRDTGEMVQTSAMIAASLKHSFSSLHLCDSNEANVQALQSSVAKANELARTNIYCGDSNDLAQKVFNKIPLNRCLTVTVLDPFNLDSLKFETVCVVAQRQSDLIVLLPDAMDAERNAFTYYAPQSDSKLDRFLGRPDWRERLNGLHGSKFHAEFRAIYIEQLESVGFTRFRSQRIHNSVGQPLYQLLFASRHDLGLKFWDAACKKDEGGQGSFW